MPQRVWSYVIIPVGLVALILAVFGATRYALGDGGDTIHACVNNASGTVKIVSEGTTCANNEHALEWGTEGEPGAPGAPGSTGVPGEPGPTGEPGADGEPATSLWAVVNVDGTIARGSHVVSARREAVAGPGWVRYHVKWDRDVSACAYLATAEVEPGENPVWLATVKRNALLSDEVDVATWRESVTTFGSDLLAFQVAVLC